MRYATLRSRDAFSVGLIHLGAKDLATPNPPDNPNGTRLSPMSSVRSVTYVSGPDKGALARSERFELPTLGIEIRCSIQLSYERVSDPVSSTGPDQKQG